jgi:hypothetical protein
MTPENETVLPQGQSFVTRRATGDQVCTQYFWLAMTAETGSSTDRLFGSLGSASQYRTRGSTFPWPDY